MGLLGCLFSLVTTTPMVIAADIHRLTCHYRHPSPHALVTSGRLAAMSLVHPSRLTQSRHQRHPSPHSSLETPATVQWPHWTVVSNSRARRLKRALSLLACMLARAHDYHTPFKEYMMRSATGVYVFFMHRTTAPVPVHSSFSRPLAGTQYTYNR